MDSNDCIRCLDKLVQWHDASEKNAKLEKDVKKLKKKFRRIQKRLKAANDLWMPKMPFSPCYLTDNAPIASLSAL